MPLPLLYEKFDRSFTCGIPKMKPGSSRNSGVFRTGKARSGTRHPSAGAVTGDQLGCRRETLCGAFLPRDFGITGVTVGLMVGLSCRSGSIEVILLQASHL
jgi:hypothetical protein